MKNFLKHSHLDFKERFSIVEGDFSFFRHHGPLVVSLIYHSDLPLYVFFWE